jgi:hypothetical protein
LTEAQRFMIAGFETVMKNAAAGDGVIDRVLKVKLVDRAKYVELAAKYHALLVQKVDVNVTRSAPGSMRRDCARRRATKSPTREGLGTPCRCPAKSPNRTFDVA